jgi:ComF family protein
VILQFKHADGTDLAPLFARRYNQAAEICRPLSRLTGAAYLPDALVRAKATESQAGKSGAGRRRNVAAAFAVPPRRAAKVAGKRILLIDDVMTTGATLEGCARALLAAGAACVDVAVVARVKESPNRTI